MQDPSQPLIGVLALQGAFEEHQQCLEAIGCRTIQVCKGQACLVDRIESILYYIHILYTYTHIVWNGEDYTMIQHRITHRDSNMTHTLSNTIMMRTRQQTRPSRSLIILLFFVYSPFVCFCFWIHHTHTHKRFELPRIWRIWMGLSYREENLRPWD